MTKNTRFILALHLLVAFMLTAAPVFAAGDPDIYLPIVMRSSEAQAPGRVVNAPYIDASSYEIVTNHMPEMAIFWFGEMTRANNYTDVRVAYNSYSLVIQTSTFDCATWYDASTPADDLENWDSVAITLQTAVDNAQSPQTNAHRFVVGMRHWQDMANYTRQYRGNGSGWDSVATTIYSESMYVGTQGPNNNPTSGTNCNRGWFSRMSIPFSTLGLSGPPHGALWRLRVQVNDRDVNIPAGSNAPQMWPEGSQQDAPASWGSIRFGLPGYVQPPSKNPQTFELKNSINVSAPDAQVGGANGCGTDPNSFDIWGLLNYNNSSEQKVHINIQNQSDLGDLFCFSKYYITFPVSSLPPGKLIRSARLEMSHFGGSDPNTAQPSYIQVFNVSPDWNETTINWNNAPMAIENLDGAWVNVFIFKEPMDWQTIPRYQWDVTRAVDAAYRSGQPVRLALYSADSARDSGKYFISSDDTWNVRNLPALVIETVDP